MAQKFANSINRGDVEGTLEFVAAQASAETLDIVRAAANLLFAPLSRRAEMLRALHEIVHDARTITVVDEPKIEA